MRVPGGHGTRPEPILRGSVTQGAAPPLGGTPLPTRRDPGDDPCSRWRAVRASLIRVSFFLHTSSPNPAGHGYRWDLMSQPVPGTRGRLRALELQKDHVPAIHMVGMMLEELPRFMGGNPEAALEYLERAVTLDPTYTHARLDLAKMYAKRKKTELAKRELLAIVNMDHPRDPYAWAKEYRPEAERLLESLTHAK